MVAHLGLRTHELLLYEESVNISAEILSGYPTILNLSCLN